MRLFSCAFFRKVVCRHDTGMGESYMDGDYEVLAPLPPLFSSTRWSYYPQATGSIGPSSLSLSVRKMELPALLSRECSFTHHLTIS